MDSATLEEGDLASSGPTASQVAIAREEWQRAECPETPRDERIVNWLKRGQSLEAIAQEIGVSVKTIRRVLDRIKLHHGVRGG